MTKEEQLKDIERRTGLSVAIIRKVWQGTRDSLIESLSKGNSYVLHGICTLKTSDKQILNNETLEIETHKSVQIRVSETIGKDINNYSKSDNTDSIDTDNQEIPLQIVDNDVLTYELSVFK